MSARTLWILGMVTAILFVEGLIVRPMAEWTFGKAIVSEGVPYTSVFPSPKSKDEVVPDVIGEPELKRLTLSEKWDIIYPRDRAGSVKAAIALIVMGILLGVLLGSIGLRYATRWGNGLAALSTTDKIAGFLGLVLGVLLSGIVLPIVLGMLQMQSRWIIFLGWGGITYLCVLATMSMREDLRAYFFPNVGVIHSSDSDDEKAYQKPKILDTNVIIDGRVSDVCRTGFVEGQVIVPTFVLDELQHIADSSDSLRRARGRRGLDILNQMRKDLKLSIRQSSPIDPANTEEVDARLVKLAKEIDGCIVTNDFNLNKVAELQGVPVLNVNELANALKPVVLPGEEMTVTIIKEGKELNQGIAYLDDGTMVVVEGARRHINETVDCTVTSVLQTVAGKMIFANLKQVQEEEDDLIDRNVRNYSGFRPRKKIR